MRKHDCDSDAAYDRFETEKDEGHSAGNEVHSGGVSVEMTRVLIVVRRCVTPGRCCSMTAAIANNAEIVAVSATFI